MGLNREFAKQAAENPVGKIVPYSLDFTLTLYLDKQTYSGGFMRYGCPCCNFLTLDEKPPGSFVICPVCGWEDDIAQFYNPNLAGGANLVSLNEARRNFADFAASDRKCLARVRAAKADEIDKP